MDRLKLELDGETFKKLEGFTCPVPECAEFVEGYLDELKHHLKTHNLNTSRKNAMPLRCSCGSIQDSFKTLKVHVLKHHPRAIIPESGPSCAPVPMDVDKEQRPEEEDLFCHGTPSFKEDLRKMAAKAISQLRSDLALTEAKVQVFIKVCDQILSSYQRFSVGVITDFLSTRGIDPQDTNKLLSDLEVSGIFDDVSNPDLNLSYLSGKARRSVPGPVEIELGIRKEKKTIRYMVGKKGNQKKFDSVEKVAVLKDKMHYIPIKDTLTLIFSNPAARDMLLQEDQSTDGFIRGFKDGMLFSSLDFFKNHPFGVRISLHIDDVEYCNPLGSRKGKHKLTVIAFKIQNFNPKINSGLDRVYVTLLATSKCVKKYGFGIILKPLLKDLMALESESGIAITINGNESFTLRATVVHVLGDTAAFHELFELMPAQSNIFCRACYVTRNSLHSGSFGIHPLRTRVSVDRDLMALQNGTTTPSKCGILRAPVLHSLKQFHFAENLTFDPMHDILEGVVSMVLKLILNSFVNDRKILSESNLNTRIEGFDYGAAEAKDKPSGNFTAKSLRSKGYTLSLSASQIWLFLRAFNFIFADVIGNDHREIVSFLLKISFFAFSNVLTNDAINELEITIQKFYSSFKDCFSVNPINKVHHLCHYPTLLRQSGPISFMACLPYEGKYKELKSLTKTCGNFRNLTYSLAKRINLKQTAAIIDHDYAIDTISVMSSSVTKKQFLECSLLLFDLPEDVENVRSMVINGVNFQPGLVVKYDTFNGQNYGIINYILGTNNQFICVIQVLNVIELCDSLLSYKIEITSQIVRTPMNKISTKKCYSLWRVTNANEEHLYISMKYND